MLHNFAVEVEKDARQTFVLFSLVLNFTVFITSATDLNYMLWFLLCQPPYIVFYSVIPYKKEF